MGPSYSLHSSSPPFTPTIYHRRIMQRKKVGLYRTDTLPGAVSSQCTVHWDKQGGKAINPSADGLLLDWIMIPQKNGQ